MPGTQQQDRLANAAQPEDDRAGLVRSRPRQRLRVPINASKGARSGSAPTPLAGLRSASMRAGIAAELGRCGQWGWPRRFPIAQFPNPPLLLAFAGWGLGAESGGITHEVGRAVFTLGLAVWAWKEAVGGVNWFRRLLGVGALVWIVTGLAGEP
jgi:hypothetical protein